MRQADEDRFREFARTQAQLLRRCAYLLCGDWHLADDLVQTTLIKLYGAWPRISDTDRPVSYARTTLVRCWLDERRRPWRRAEERSGHVPDIEDVTVAPGRAPDRAAVRAELLAALATLPRRQRAVLVLRFFTGLSVQEAAAELRCSEGTVKSHTARALDNLRTHDFQRSVF